MNNGMNNGMNEETASADNIGELMRTRLPEAALLALEEIGQWLEVRGWRAYVVGGFVRDLLLDRPNLDIDIMVEGCAPELGRDLAEAWRTRLIVHDCFMTAALTTPSGLRVDLATARREVYPKPAELPRVEPAGAIQDLSRRDFSINAIAACINSDAFGQILDPFDGRGDLKRKHIRVLHDGSFVDDPTRIFRAVRYEQRFKFQIETHTLTLLERARNGGYVALLSRDRLKHELIRQLREEKPQDALRRLSQLNLLPLIHAALHFDKESYHLMSELEAVLDGLRSIKPNLPSDDWVTLLMPLIWCSPKQLVIQFCEEFGIGGDERVALEQVVGLVGQVESLLESKPDLLPSVAKESLDVLRLQAVLFALAVGRIRNSRAAGIIRRYLETYRDATADISGDDLLAAGIEPGPAIAKGLKAALAAKLDRNSSRQEQLAIALEAARQSQ